MRVLMQMPPLSGQILESLCQKTSLILRHPHSKLGCFHQAKLVGRSGSSDSFQHWPNSGQSIGSLRPEGSKPSQAGRPRRLQKNFPIFETRKFAWAESSIGPGSKEGGIQLFWDTEPQSWPKSWSRTPETSSRDQLDNTVKLTKKSWSGRFSK